MIENLAKELALSRANIHGVPGREHIPKRSHDKAIAKARRHDPPGTTVLRHQYKGALIGSLFIDNAINLPPADLRVATGIVTAAAWRSASFAYMLGRQPMWRRLTLPMIVDPETGEPLSAEARELATKDRMEVSVEASRLLIGDMLRHKRVSADASRVFARATGEAALWVELLNHPELGQTGTPEKVQANVREIGLQSVEAAQAFGSRLHKDPSYAMIGDPATTEIDTYLDEQKLDDVYEAFRAASARAERLVPAA